MKRVSLPVAITIICGLIFLGLAATFVTRKQGKLEPKETIKRTDYTQVARKTLDWIDQQRNEDGWYILGKTCGEKDCEQVVDDAEEGNKDGLIATWARLNFFEQHQDPKDLEIVKKDIDLFYNKYKGDNLSDSLWLCKITYEMAQSKHLDQTQKDKLKKLCLNKKFIGFDDQVWDKEKLNLMKNYDLSKGMNFSYYFLMFHQLYPWFGDMSDLLFKYRFTSDLNSIKVIKDDFVGVANKVSDDLYVSNKCILGMGSLDLYELLKAKNNLDYAIDIYEKTSQGDQSVFDPFCGLLLKNIYRITNDKKYLELIEKNNKSLVENYNEHNINSFFVSLNTYPKRDVFMNGLFVEIIR
jgi:hypothetical protein